jgi:hypothetical protein
LTVSGRPGPNASDGGRRSPEPPNGPITEQEVRVRDPRAPLVRTSAEGVGFEPTDPLRGLRFSRPVHSATMRTLPAAGTAKLVIAAARIIHYWGCHVQVTTGCPRVDDAGETTSCSGSRSVWPPRSRQTWDGRGQCPAVLGTSAVVQTEKVDDHIDGAGAVEVGDEDPAGSCSWWSPCRRTLAEGTGRAARTA